MTTDSVPDKRCAIYARKSTSQGMDQQYTSIDAQIDACAKYVEAHMADGWRLVGSYQDVAISGGTMNRPGLQEMLRHVREGKIDTIVTYKLDRISRSIRDFANLMYELDELGVGLVIITQNFDTSSPMGKLCINFLSSFAEFERDMIRSRIRDKASANAEHGLWIGGSPPYGYKLGDKRALVPVEEEAPFVRDMFRMSAEGHSPQKIAAYLNESGAPLPHTRQNKSPLPWTPEKVRLVLQRRLYAGIISHGGKEYPGKHEALVSEAEWRAGRNGVQTHPTQTRRKSHPDICYPLPGLLHCPCCGRKMGVTYSSGKGTVHRYYTCVGRTGRRKDCKYPNLPAAEIERVVAAQLVDYAEDETVLSIVRARYPQLTSQDIREALSDAGELVGHLSHPALKAIFHTLFKGVVYDIEENELRIERYTA